jgi:Fe2+ or Zn2+ uptake regulation protein
MATKHVQEMAALKEHLGKHQLKLTRQREMILSAFLRQEHITAEAMYHQLAKSDPHLGLATIYRTLNLFCDAGLAQARHFGSKPNTTTSRTRPPITSSVPGARRLWGENGKLSGSRSGRGTGYHQDPPT